MRIKPQSWAVSVGNFLQNPTALVFFSDRFHNCYTACIKWMRKGLHGCSHLKNPLILVSCWLRSCSTWSAHSVCISSTNFRNLSFSSVAGYYPLWATRWAQAYSLQDLSSDIMSASSALHRWFSVICKVPHIQRGIFIFYFWTSETDCGRPVAVT